MHTVTYTCTCCEKDSALKFGRGYKPFVAFTYSCLKCGKYAKHLLKSVLNMDQSVNGPITR